MTREELLGILLREWTENRERSDPGAGTQLDFDPFCQYAKRGLYVTYSRGKSGLFAHLENGRYEDFLQNCLAPAADASDWEKVRYKLRLKALAKSFSEQSGSYETELAYPHGAHDALGTFSSLSRQMRSTLIPKPDDRDFTGCS